MKLFDIITKITRRDLVTHGMKSFLYGLNGTTPTMIKVNDNGELIGADLGNYKAANMDTSTPAYYGFVDKDGNWYIMKEATSGSVKTYTYCKGTSGYATAWTNRATQTYDTYDNTF